MKGKKIKVVNIVGARPNFMKIAPIVEEMQKADFHQILVHTGQHYDYKMSKLFFDELGLHKPHINLGVGSGSHAEQTAEVMRRVEPVFIKENPDIALVVGDVNSTLACALTASKLGIPVAHVEAGLRSFDRSMPEEINRVLTDAISDYLFVTEDSGLVNLTNEGISKEKIFFVGNTMIDSLLRHKKKAEIISPLNGVYIKHQSYGVLTLHRPNNVENRENLKNILEAIKKLSIDIPIIFPVHPRTRKQIKDFGLINLLSDITEETSMPITVSTKGNKNLILPKSPQPPENPPISPFNKGGQRGTKKGRYDSIPRGNKRGLIKGGVGGFSDQIISGIYMVEPLGYLQFLSLMIGAKLVFTDSGGIQEEATVLDIPCITLRENTERPITLTSGTNVLVGADKDKIIQEAKKRLNGFESNRQLPRFWDGKAAKRIVKVLVDQLTG